MLPDTSKSHRVMQLFALALVSSALLTTAIAGQNIRLFDKWKFYQGNSTTAQQTTFNDASWQSVSLPHTVRVESFTSGYYQGYCWYRRSFVVPVNFRSKKVFLEFEGAMHLANVWLNGNSVGTDSGRYKPFVFDITNGLLVGQTNVIAVQLNNSNISDIPPGNSNPDFRYYGGLYRNVYLHITDSLHITDPIFENSTAGGGIFVTYPLVSAASATVQVKTHVRNEYTNQRTVVCQSSLIDSGGNIAATQSTTQAIAAAGTYTFTQTFSVANPMLWHPDHPNLYTVRSQVFDNTRLADEQITTIGIRTISVTKAGGLLINGIRYKGLGADRHQEYPYIGNAVPNSGQYRDALHMKQGGLNFVRMCHYIQPKAFVDACDKLGVLGMGCLPGWQYYSSNAAFVRNALDDLKKMIRWYRNHPSIVLWEIVHNESSDPAAFVNQSQALAHAEYPGNQMFTCGEESNAICDLYMSSTQAGVRSYTGSRPAAISECGDWEYGGASSTSRVSRGGGEAGMLQQTANHIQTVNTNLALPWFTVEGLWSMFDYCGWQVPLRSGVMDIFRLPKYSYYFHQSQRDPAVILPNVKSGPMVFIASSWTAQSARPVKVFSNCAQVSLYLNGTLVATQSPDAGTAVSSLPHPPFTFAIPAFAAGTLKAVGLIGGAIKAADSVKTPGAAAKIVVTIDTAGLTFNADGSDIAIVYASVLDANGTVIPTATNSIQFTVAGPGAIIGPNPQTAEAGIATVLLQSTTTPGTITVSATSGTLTASTTVTSIYVPSYEGLVPTLRQKPEGRHSASAPVLRTTSNGRYIVFSTATYSTVSSVNCRIFTAQGKLLGSISVGKDGVAALPKFMSHGVYLGQLLVNDRVVDKINFVL